MCSSCDKFPRYNCNPRWQGQYPFLSRSEFGLTSKHTPSTTAWILFCLRPHSSCGADACPSNGTDACGEGHHGVACALCLPTWGLNARYKCVKCPQDRKAPIAWFAAAGTIGLFLVLYLWSTQPWREASQSLGPLARLWQPCSRLGCVQQVSRALHRLLSTAATRYSQACLHGVSHACDGTVVTSRRHIGARIPVTRGSTLSDSFGPTARALQDPRHIRLGIPAFPPRQNFAHTT